MAVVIDKLPSIPFSTLAFLRPPHIIRLAFAIHSGENWSVVLPSINGVVIHACCTKPLFAFLPPVRPIMQSLESHVPVIFTAHQTCDRTSRCPLTCYLFPVLIELYIEGGVVVRCEMSIYSARVRFVGTPASRTDGLLATFPRKGTDKILKRV